RLHCVGSIHEARSRRRVGPLLPRTARLALGAGRGQASVATLRPCPGTLDGEAAVRDRQWKSSTLSTAGNCSEPSEPALHRRIEVGSRILLHETDDAVAAEAQPNPHVNHRGRDPDRHAGSGYLRPITTDPAGASRPRAETGSMAIAAPFSTINAWSKLFTVGQTCRGTR